MTGKQAGQAAVIARGLTAGETRLARAVFGTALDPSRVRIHNRPYMPGQGKGVAMTPNGDVWFRPEDYVADFSLNVGKSAWLVHELVHAWQYQTNRSTRVRGFFEHAGRLIGLDPYRYGQLDPAKPFASYKNEQQAAIVEDYFRLTQRLQPRFGSGSLQDYRAVIPFLPRPAARRR